jgi:hypothetical protein
MDGPPKLKLDNIGNIITQPVTGWTVSPVAGAAVLAVIRYVDSPEELERGEDKQVQLLLNPDRCLEFAEALTKLARSLLQPPPRETTRQ